MSDELLDPLLVGRLPMTRLENLFAENASCDRIEFQTLDARRFFKLAPSIALRRDQLWAGAERCEVATDDARLEQFKAVVLLDDRDAGMI